MSSVIRYESASQRIFRFVAYILSEAFTIYAVLIGSEFLYNGIRFTEGPQMTVFVLPIIPVFAAGFVFAFLGPILIRKYSGQPQFFAKTITLLAWQAVACGVIGFLRLIVLNSIFETELSITVGLLGVWFLYTTIAVFAAGVAALVAVFAIARNTT